MEMDTINKIALYQRWPPRELRRYSEVYLSKPTICVTVFPADKDGLDQAINVAERKDAQLVKLDRDYANGESLQKAVELKIKQGKGVDVFKVSAKIPRS